MARTLCLVKYQGDLRCEALNDFSGVKLRTDAPVDNQGKGEFFSPTDLIATALLTCMITTMAISAKREGVDIAGARGSVVKEMNEAPRRIASLRVTIEIPISLSEVMRQKFESYALHCPVYSSLSSDIEKDVKFVWADNNH